MEQSLNISFPYNDTAYEAEIHTCCEDNVFYYDVWSDGQYQFTVSQGTTDGLPEWKVSLKNADKAVDPALVKMIGEQIEGSKTL